MKKYYIASLEKAKDEAKSLSIDFTELITCPQCKYYDKKQHGCAVRNDTEVYTSRDFCSWGVKK